METPLAAVTFALLGMLVLWSYILCFRSSNKSEKSTSSFLDPYVTSTYWYGMSPHLVKTIMAFQILAIIGAFMGTVSFLSNEPSEGIGSNRRYQMFIVMFLVSSLIWPWSLVSGKSKVFTSGSLVSAAVACILLIASAAEDANPSRVPIVGWVLLSTTTVLIDSVAWNSRYIIKA